MGLNDLEKLVHSTSPIQRSEVRKLQFESKIAVSIYMVVDSSGNERFKTVQDAVDAVPVDNSEWVYIRIKAGVYREKVVIPYNKPNIMFEGDGRESTRIMWDLAADADGSTADSAAFSSFAPNFTAKDISFWNDSPRPPPGANGKQAVAALLAGDMAAFYECGFHGVQDTLFDYQGRHYFKTCYIEGSIDFIFGHGQSTYKGCQLNVTADKGYLSGSITAQNRASPAENSGFVFIACKITGTGQVFLGRAWGAYSRVIFAYTYMANIIAPQGWNDGDYWGMSSWNRTVEYGEYQCYGPGANKEDRVKWSHKLTVIAVKPFLDLSFIDASQWLQEY